MFLFLLVKDDCEKMKKIRSKKDEKTHMTHTHSLRLLSFYVRENLWDDHIIIMCRMMWHAHGP